MSNRLPFVDTQTEAGCEDASRAAGLVQAAAEGSESAFSELYQLFSQGIYNLVLRSVRDRQTAEDLCQEIWLKAHAEIAGLRNPAAARAWLYRIASHACIDYVRSASARHAGDSELIDDLFQARDPQPEDAAIRDSEVRMVWETLGAMTPRQSIALYLKQVDGCSYNEIASILGCPKSTVETLLFRARHSFARAYSRLESSNVERCHLFQQVMAGIIDQEPTGLQRSAIEAHVQECLPCRAELLLMGKGSRAYGALPLLTLSKELLLPMIAGGAATASSAGIGAGSAGLLGGALKMKLLLIFGLLAAGSGAASTAIIGVPSLPFSSQPSSVVSRPLSPPGHEKSDTAGVTLVDDRTPSASATDASTPQAQAPAAGLPEPSASNEPSDEVPAGALDNSGPLAAPPASWPDSDPQQPASEPPAATPDSGDNGLDNPVDNLVGNTVQTLDNTLDGVAQLADDTLTGLGDTLDGVTDTAAPLDPLVEDLTGVSVTGTLEQLPDVLPDEGDQPVSDLLDDVTSPILDPLLPAGDTPGAGDPPAEEPSPDSGSCLLGLLCAGD